jgi:hypothetical protein
MYYECVSEAFGIQPAMRMRHNFFCNISLPQFSTLAHKGRDFRRRVTESKMCVLIFSANVVSNISHSKNNSVRFNHKCA